MAVKRLLVTGRQGFVGGTITRMFADDALARGHLRDWELIADDGVWNLLDKPAVHRVIGETRPDAVIHLAAQSSVPESFRDPETTWRVNTFGTLNLLQGLKAHGFAGRFLYAGTGDVYGKVGEDELPIRETRPLAPRNPYAASKAAAEAMCMQWAFSESMAIVLARPFNHIGPGQSDRFVVSALARQIAAIRAGRCEPVIVVGDIDVTRDFTDVRDVVAAYFSLLERGEPGECYNVCSGTERTVRSLLERMLASAGVEARIEVDTSRLRAAEQRRARGDPSKIHRATGWLAATPIDRSLSDSLTYWERTLPNG